MKPSVGESFQKSVDSLYGGRTGIDRPKESITVAGRTRVPDGLITGIAGTPGVLSEVKNVKALSYTQQLRDYAAFAQQNNFRFDLYVRQGAKLSGPLEQAIGSGAITLKTIPTP